jgi:hypothetical protein
MRVQSQKPKQLMGGETGWVHPLDGTKKIFFAAPEIEKTAIDCMHLWKNWRGITGPLMLDDLAKDLGVEPWSMAAIGAVYAVEHRAWAFPMWDGFGHMIGIRLRAADGHKWTVKNTHTGIFVPFINPKPTCLICEGPTDTAAALSLGYYAVGRPSCSGGSMHIKDLFQRLGVRHAVIIADNDEPGLNGAKGLADTLMIRCCIIVLPTKDMREFVQRGGTKKMLDCIINQEISICK